MQKTKQQTGKLTLIHDQINRIIF